MKIAVKLQLTTERDERDEAGEPTGARAAAISGRNPSSGRPAAAWHSEAVPRGRTGQQGSSDRRGRRRCSRIAGWGRGGRRTGAARRRFSCWEEEVRPATYRLSVTSRGADVFWADTKREEVGVAERRKMCLFPYRTGPRTTSGRGSW